MGGPGRRWSKRFYKEPSRSEARRIARFLVTVLCRFLVEWMVSILSLQVVDYDRDQRVRLLYTTSLSARNGDSSVPPYKVYRTSSITLSAKTSIEIFHGPSSLNVHDTGFSTRYFQI